MFLVDNYERLSLPRILIAAVLTSVLILGGIFWFDIPVQQLLRRLDCGFIEFFTMFGATKFILCASFIVFIFKVWSTGIFSKRADQIVKFIMSGRSKILTTSAIVFISTLCAAICTGALKFIIGRYRPVLFETMGATGFEPFSVQDLFHSMPSGHTTATFAALISIGLMFPKIKKYTWTLAILLGLSRIIVGAHYPTDVIFGAFIGMITADVVYLSFKRANEK
jgi:membrane-associated phospholipid phosphatase